MPAKAIKKLLYKLKTIFSNILTIKPIDLVKTFSLNTISYKEIKYI